MNYSGNSIYVLENIKFKFFDRSIIHLYFFVNVVKDFDHNFNTYRYIHAD